MKRSGLAGQYCYGDSITMADICLVPQVANAQRFDCDLGPYPLVTAIAERCLQHEAFKKADPSTQKDAF
jgi:glutathione S-transferase